MLILSRLFRNKVKVDEEADEIKELELLYAEVYPVPRYYPELKHGCEYCHNESGVSDGRGGCISCGAPLPKLEELEKTTCYSCT